MILQDFINEIIASPYDDLPRLIAADWLEETGEPEVAGFIRYQIGNPKSLDSRVTLIANAYGGYNFSGYPRNPILCGHATAFFLKMITGLPPQTFIVFQRGFPEKVLSAYRINKEYQNKVFDMWPVSQVNETKRAFKKATKSKLNTRNLCEV